MTRTNLLALLLALPLAIAPTDAAPAPVKPKVLSTPAPVPTKPTRPVKPAPAPPAAAPVQPTPADDTPKPVRRRPVQKSVPTLVAEYTKTVKAALGGRWQEAATEKASEFTSGSLSITFKVDAEGKVVEFTVKANTSNDALAAFCEALVKGTSFEKPPARALTEGQLEIPFNFTIY